MSFLSLDAINTTIRLNKKLHNMNKWVIGGGMNLTHRIGKKEKKMKNEKN